MKKLNKAAPRFEAGAKFETCCYDILILCELPDTPTTHLPEKEPNTNFHTYLQFAVGEKVNYGSVRFIRKIEIIFSYFCTIFPLLNLTIQYYLHLQVLMIFCNRCKHPLHHLIQTLRLPYLRKLENQLGLF